jgi:hypothetical protein
MSGSHGTVSVRIEAGRERCENHPVRRIQVKWVWRGGGVLVAVYIVFFSAMLLAMTRPPEQFGRIMRHVPMPLMRALPFPPMWLWARQGTLAHGDRAPDFTLPTADHTGTVTLSSHRGERPVVLVFGSYT